MLGSLKTIIMWFSVELIVTKNGRRLSNSTISLIQILFRMLSYRLISLTQTAGRMLFTALVAIVVCEKKIGTIDKREVGKKNTFIKGQLE